MTCITAFKINIAMVADNQLDELIEDIGIEPGFTNQFLFYGLQKRDTEELEYTLYDQLHDTLSVVYEKKEILKKLTTIYPISYIVEVRFSDIEEEIERNTSFTITDEAKEFIAYIDAYYNLNNGYGLG